MIQVTFTQGPIPLEWMDALTDPVKLQALSDQIDQDILDDIFGRMAATCSMVTATGEV